MSEDLPPAGSGEHAGPRHSRGRRSRRPHRRRRGPPLIQREKHSIPGPASLAPATVNPEDPLASGPSSGEQDSAIRHTHEFRSRPHSPGRETSAIIRAIEQVDQILASLKETVDEMEEVLEILEQAERQKTGDEREIESLQRALNRVQRERGVGSRQPQRQSEPPNPAAGD